MVELNAGFLQATAYSGCVIVVSEFGDMTFFIAAILAMKHSRLTVFTGAMLANCLMAILSACISLTAIALPRVITFYLATALLIVFGLKMLSEGYRMSPNKSEKELMEADDQIRNRDSEIKKRRRFGLVRLLYDSVLAEAFLLTFWAEWGDRSQISTFLLSIRENISGVICGCILGHSFCTGVAVLSGRFLASWISLRTVTMVGGALFILFAVSGILNGLDE